VSFSFSSRGTEFLDSEQARITIARAFQTWSDQPCDRVGIAGKASLHLEETKPVTCWKSRFLEEGPNVNVVLFRDGNWNFSGTHGTIATTRTHRNLDTGEILDADIEINSAHFRVTSTDVPSSVRYDLQSVITHEIGHFIGIGHSEDPNAVMAARYDQGSIRFRELTDDDLRALCTIYPPGRDAECDPVPHGGFDATCNNPQLAEICTVGRVGASSAPVVIVNGKAAPPPPSAQWRSGLRGKFAMPCFAILTVAVTASAALVRRLRRKPGHQP